MLFLKSNKTVVLECESDSLISSITVKYTINSNLAPDIEIRDLSNKEAPIQNCVGNIGMCFDLTGDMSEYKMSQMEVVLKYNEEALEDIYGEYSYKTDPNNWVVLCMDDPYTRPEKVETKGDMKSNTISFKTDKLGEYIVVDEDEWDSAWK